MPTCKDALEYYKKAVRDGKGDMHTGRPFISEEEEAKRQTNAPDSEGKQKTRIAWDAADPDVYSEWHRERIRWMKRANKNPTLATEAMILGLRAYSEEAIDKLIETLGDIRAKMSGVPKAVIPPAVILEEDADAAFVLGQSEPENCE